MHTEWRFALARSSDRSIIGELTQARSRSLDFLLNRPGTGRFSLPLTDAMAYEVKPIETCLIAYRDVIDNAAQVRWSGPVWTTEENLPDGNLNVGCVGWFEELNVARLLRVDATYNNLTSPGVGGVDRVGANWTASVVAQDLLAYANAQQDTTNTVRPTKISWGGFTQMNALGDPTRTKKWAKGTHIGQAIQEFSDLESGYDMEVKLDSNKVPRLYLYDKKMVDRPEIVFGYNTAARNLQSAARSIDGSRTMNRMLAQGKFGSALAEDTVAVDGLTPIQRYGIFEEWASLTDVVDVNILLAYAGAEVLVRSHPLVQYSLTPFPYNAGGFVPKLFIDYDIGDQVYLSVNYGRFQVTKQAIRVFGASLTIDDNGNEQISSLATAPS